MERCGDVNDYDIRDDSGLATEEVRLISSKNCQFININSKFIS